MKILTSFIFALLLAITGFVPAYSQIPAEVRNAFKAYQAAEKSGDKDVALKAARNAWQAAETHMGDVRLTGDLAFNYANQPVAKKRDDQFDAVERSMELAAEYGADGPVVYLERAMLQSGLFIFSRTPQTAFDPPIPYMPTSTGVTPMRMRVITWGLRAGIRRSWK